MVDRQVLHQAGGIRHLRRAAEPRPQVDNDNLRLRFEILYSRFYVLETVSESTQPLYAEPGYPEVVKQMRLQMDRIDKLLDSPTIDFDQVFAAMKAIKPYAIEMANLTDHAEVKQRTAAYEDYIEKRHIIFYGLVIVMFSVIALIAITLIVFRQQRLTIRQQAKAIEAEKATRTKTPSSAPSATSCAPHCRA